MCQIVRRETPVHLLELEFANPVFSPEVFQQVPPVIEGGPPELFDT